MKNILFLAVIVLLISACDKDSGESFVTYRNIANGTIVTGRGVYLHMNTLNPKDSIKYIDDDPTLVQVFTLLQNIDIEEVESGGYCWSEVNPDPQLNDASSFSDKGNLNPTKGELMSFVTNLRVLSEYYIRAYFITKGRELEDGTTTKADTAYSSVITKFETKYIGNIWLSKKNLLFGGRRGSVCFTVGSKAYMGTGEDNSQNYYDDMWQYDPVTDAWTQMDDVGTPTIIDTRCKFAVGVSDGTYGYVGLGERNDEILDRNFWKFDPAQNKWTKAQDFIGPKRSRATAFSVGGKLYVGLGEYGQSLATRTPLADFYQYTPASDSWQVQADFLGGKRTSATSFVMGSNGYVVGGVDETGLYPTTVWMFTPDAGGAEGDWLPKSNPFLGAGRVGAVGFAVQGRGYIALGQDKDGALLKDLWRYLPEEDHWQQKAELKANARKQAVAFALGYRGYIAGGYDTDNTFRADLWEYIPDSLDESIIRQGR